MRLMKRFSWLLLFGLLFLTPSLSFAQVAEQWVRTYNSSENGSDAPTAMAVDHDGNVYVSGRSEGIEAADVYTTIKYSSEGTMLWIKKSNKTFGYGGPAIAVDATGNVYVTGSMASNNFSADYGTIKYDPNGKELWIKTYDGPEHAGDFPSSIAVDQVGNVYVTGSSSGKESGLDYATIKYDAEGNELWVKRYDGLGRKLDIPSSLAVDASGNVYVTGYSESGDGITFYNYDFATLKYDNAGNVLWIKRFNGPGNSYDRAFSLAVDTAGNVYVTGSSQVSRVNLDDDYATVKYDKNGNELWVAGYDGPHHSQDVGVSVAVDKGGNVYVTGSSAEDIAENEYNIFDYATVKYDSKGKQLWSIRYDGPGITDDHASKIVLDTAGNAYVTGKSSFYFTTIKYSLEGHEVWTTRYNTGAVNQFEPGIFLALDAHNNVYITGAIGNDDAFDQALIKYAQSQVTTWYRDADGDGFGNPNSSKEGKEQPRGYVANNLDCNDKNKVKGGPELCDGIDNDCDGIIDNGLTETTFYSDFDGDGYGTPKRSITTCAPPPRFVANNEDHNDDNKNVFPGAPELCDGRDNNQDGEIDEGFTKTTFYHDFDKDGYGRSEVTLQACAAPLNYVARGGDCNDRDPNIHPGASGPPNDGIDNNCNGEVDEPATVLTYNKVIVEKEPVVTRLQLRVTPNPSQHYFNLRLESNNNRPVQLRVVDALGRIVEGRDGVAPNATLRFGQQYRPGIYYVHVLQGAKQVTLKLIKTAQ